MRITIRLMFMLCALLSALLVKAQDEPLSSPKSLNWSPDGTKIATGHRDGYVAIWDASTGELLENYQLTSPSTPDRSLQTMRRVRWSPDGTYLAIAEMRDVPFSIIVVLDAATGARITHMETQGLFSDIAWSPDGQFLASVVSSVSQIALADALVIWNPMTGEEIRRINPPELVGLNSLDWSPDGQKIVVGGTIDNLVTIWDVATSNKLQTLVGHTQQTDSVDWSAVTGQIVSDSSGDKTINIWNSTTGQLLHSISVEGFPEEVKWQPHNPILAVVTVEKILVIDAITGQITETIALSDFTGSEQIAWSPYGGRLAYTRIIPASDQGMTSSSNLNDNGIEMIVPIASIEQLNAIATACQTEAFVPEQTQPLLNADRVNSLTTDALPDFVAQVEALPEGAIPAACRADLLAVAGALR